MTPDEFIDMVCERPLWQNPMARVRTLAKELAEGALEELWDVNILLDRGRIKEDKVLEYLERRWRNNYPKLPVLARSGYLDHDGNFLFIG